MTGTDAGDSRAGTMKIGFMSTMDEKVAAHMRLMEISGTVSKRRWIPLVLGPPGSLVLWLVLEVDRAGRLLLAGLFLVLYTVLHLARYRKDMEREVRRALVKAAGTAEDTPAEYEISPRGITFRSPGMEITFEWGSVISVARERDALEYVVRPTGICRVPLRVFGSPETMESWLEESRLRVSAAGRLGPAGSMPPPGSE